MAGKIYIHPVPVRLWHWLNAAGFLALIVTGFQIRYADMLDIMPLKTAITLHNYVGIGVIFNYFLWLAYYICSGNIRIYIPDFRNFIALSLQQIKYYGYGYFIGHPNPHTITQNNKFNEPQKKTYIMIMLMLLPAQIISGIFLLKIKGYSGYIDILGGIKVIDTIHVVVFFLFNLFILVHCYLATLGNNIFGHFKSMFTGYEDEH